MLGTRKERSLKFARIITKILCFLVIVGFTNGALAVDTVRVMTFNILQGGAPANEIGSTSPLFNQPRYDQIAAAIIQSGADVVGVQENSKPAEILSRLQADDANWQRRGDIYSRLPLSAVSPGNQDLSLARVDLGNGKTMVVHNTHWTPANYGPMIVQERMIVGGSLTEQDILAASDKGAQYQNTVNKVKPYLDAGDIVVLTGDFNEPSHLDWSENYATQGGDRWVNNPTNTALRFDVEWKGSKALAEAGMLDAYREYFDDEVAKPGDTWTPPYANGTPGRRPYDAEWDEVSQESIPRNQVLDRIDRIYVGGTDVWITNAGVVGEHNTFAEVVFEGDWPSDHRAVITTLSLIQPVPEPTSLMLMSAGGLVALRRSR